MRTTTRTPLLALSLALAACPACIPSRNREPTPRLQAPPPPAWATPAPGPAPTAPPDTAHALLPPPPVPDSSATAFVPPFPAPLSWRVAYRGAGDTYHHCPAWSRFGPVRPNGKWHKGLDIAAPTGTPVLATVDGTLRYARDPKGWGLYAQITFRPRHRSPDGACAQGEPLAFVYAHLIDDDPGRVTGKDRPVRAGEVVGHVGCSGNAKGMCSPSLESHLHLTLRHAEGDRAKIDPLPVVGWTLLTPPPEAFQPPLAACPQ